MDEARWWPFGAPGRAGGVALICFPFAGGGASIYRTWARERSGGVAVHPVQLPGREGRIRESAFPRMRDLVPVLTELLRPALAGPYAFFGHSMGALIGFELAHRLGSLGCDPPIHLFVSAARAPHLPSRRTPLHGLADEAFISALREIKGTPEQVLEHRELMDLVLPTLRADFELCETYEPGRRDPLPCPITAFGGVGDETVSAGDLHAWAELTSGGFRSVTLPGDHFFLEACSAEVLRQVREAVGAGGRPQPSGSSRVTGAGSTG